MHADIHLLLHRTTATEVHRKAVVAARRAASRDRLGRRPAVRDLRLPGPGPTGLTVTLAA
ncbi:hypothetical protein ACFY9F_00330 [Streptomyces sp. NPDC012421]|uniref:hypothetical protein n=1 Tax=Streptomyces sp. NPDC012421 TaxID=3364832 RepID=UPI0036F0561B